VVSAWEGFCVVICEQAVLVDLHLPHVFCGLMVCFRRKEVYCRLALERPPSKLATGTKIFGKTGCTALVGLSRPGLSFFGKTGMFFVMSMFVRY
jgi:hypothetical protein